MSVEQLNQDIFKWWRKLPDGLRKHWPTFIHPLKQEAQLLFVGLNPSGVDSKVGFITQEEIEKENLSGKIKQVSDQEFDFIFNGKYKRYYGQLSNVAKDLGLLYDYRDLFHVKYRDSKVLANEIFVEKEILKDEHLKHLDVFKGVLNHIKPMVVITNNVIAARIIKTQLNLSLDQDSGMYKGYGNTYFFLNGIMSYGRLTTFDKERMLWMIKKVIEV